MGKNPLDDIVDELVVFQHEDPNHPDGQYFSNNPLWNDSRIRNHWLKHNAEQEPEDDTEPEVEEVEDYAEWTNDRLREELATRGLSVDGKKVELIRRLQEDDATEE